MLKVIGRHATKRVVEDPIGTHGIETAPSGCIPFADGGIEVENTAAPHDIEPSGHGMALLGEFTDSEGEQTVIYGISRAEWNNQKISKENVK